MAAAESSSGPIGDFFRRTLEQMRGPTVSAKVKRPRDVQRLLAAQTISFFGDAMAPIAITFALLERSSVNDLGLVLAARTLPMIALLIMGGVWADRLPRASVMISCDILRVITQVGCALLVAMSSPPVWGFIVLQGVNGMATAFYRPATSGLTQQVVSDPDLRQRTNAMLSGANNLSVILGSALAGVVIAIGSPALALLLDAATFVASAVLTGSITSRPLPRISSGSAFADVASGFRYARTQPWILRQIGAFSFYQLVAVPAYLVLGPAVAANGYEGAKTWAVVVSVSGAGALIGDMLALRWSPTRPLVIANVACAVSAGIFLFLAFRSPLPMLLLGASLYGFGMGLPNVLWFTMLHQRVEPSFMARISSLDWLGSVALRPVGLMFIAPVAEYLGYALTFVIITTSVVAVLLLVASSRSIRTLRASTRDGEALPQTPSLR